MIHCRVTDSSNNLPFKHIKDNLLIPTPLGPLSNPLEDPTTPNNAPHFQAAQEEGDTTLHSHSRPIRNRYLCNNILLSILNILSICLRINNLIPNNSRPLVANRTA